MPSQLWRNSDRVLIWEAEVLSSTRVHCNGFMDFVESDRNKRWPWVVPRKAFGRCYMEAFETANLQGRSQPNLMELLLNTGPTGHAAQGRENNNGKTVVRDLTPFLRFPTTPLSRCPRELVLPAHDIRAVALPRQSRYISRCAAPIPRDA